MLLEEETMTEQMGVPEEQGDEQDEQDSEEPEDISADRLKNMVADRCFTTYESCILDLAAWVPAPPCSKCSSTTIVQLHRKQTGVCLKWVKCYLEQSEKSSHENDSFFNMSNVLRKSSILKYWSWKYFKKNQTSVQFAFSIKDLCQIKIRPVIFNILCHTLKCSNCNSLLIVIY